jgi:hypothetical protein
MPLERFSCHSSRRLELLDLVGCALAMWRGELLALVVGAFAARGPVEACPAECHCIGQARVSVFCDFRGLDASFSS